REYYIDEEGNLQYDVEGDYHHYQVIVENNIPEASLDTVEVPGGSDIQVGGTGNRKKKAK
ncbi:hypothetical protein HDU96_005371, partial [Phlyctochytrium bullatum]